MFCHSVKYSSGFFNKIMVGWFYKEVLINGGPLIREIGYMKSSNIL